MGLLAAFITASAGSRAPPPFEGLPRHVEVVGRLTEQHSPVESGRECVVSIKAIEIYGFRGFAAKQRVELALPNGKPGSGLTLIVGPNNSGKSTVVEALRFIAAD